MTEQVHAVIVAYHGAGDLDRCLACLQASIPVTIVDNSQSSAVAAVAQAHGAGYVASGRNLGFGAGVNVALCEILKGPPVDVLLLNPDAQITPVAVWQLSEALAADPRAAAAAPHIVDVDGKPQRVMWPLPRPSRSLLEAAGFGKLNAAREYAIGAVLLLRWDALRDVGLFDERFFLYAEEADWQKRSRAKGWHTAYVASACAVHVGAGTSSDPARREVLFYAGGETYMRKWHGSSGWQVTRLSALAGALVRRFVLRGEKRRAAASRAQILLKGPRKLAGFGEREQP